MTKQKQVFTDPRLLVIPKEYEKDMCLIDLADPLVVELFRRYKVRRYFNKYYLVPITNEKMPISEEDAKLVKEIQHKMCMGRGMRLLIKNINYGSFGKYKKEE